ncbi:metal ion ABC transporter, ATP-binding protein [Campylobacter blaseri]|uniref:ABC transporter n=1 Tax=Campylobacter blaseri TaxID=2042961 RepID=A0A2P8R3D0_9BACT|nr:ABC transporter ATP-binding protein [Campylobacter blaseri]PSM53001.1 ABC transporter [Campylobacter blaseri]PSM54468.1 ABC transporter [Campylobacter blaseri]QKF85288.1 metal ion ABC transporter, ATP-binding protein [Campylobacter blaseri]
MSEIVVKDLSFGYDENLVLEDINLEYNKNDFLTIIGPNGGGKSTFLKIMLGLITPKQGSIEIYGKKPQDVSSILGYVPQFIPINENFPISVLDVVLMGKIDKKKFGFYTKECKEDALEALKLVGMEACAKRRISELSGGQRQRVYIARALCSDAKILLLDEPTASIDTQGQIEIYDLLKEINKNGKGIIVISHDVNISINYATKVGHINKKLVMHEIDIEKKDNFFNHLREEHTHICDVELILRECSCKNY